MFRRGPVELSSWTPPVRRALPHERVCAPGFPALPVLEAGDPSCRRVTRRGTLAPRVIDARHSRIHRQQPVLVQGWWFGFNELLERFGKLTGAVIRIAKRNDLHAQLGVAG